MAKPPNIQVIVIDPLRQTVEKHWVENSLGEMQTLVGGSVQAIYPECLGGECLYLNEDGKMNCPDHFVLRTFEHDVLHGTAIVLGTDRNGGNKSTGWSPEEIEEFITWPGGAKHQAATREALEAVPGFGSF